MGKHAKKWYDLGYKHGGGDKKMVLARQKKEIIDAIYFDMQGRFDKDIEDKIAKLLRSHQAIKTIRDR